MRIVNATLVTPQGSRALTGEQMSRLRVEPNTTVVVDQSSGLITYIGHDADAPAAEHDEQTIDACGRALLPGFIDSHTHLIFGGFRPDEFKMRLNGASYMDIMRAGGGIQSTVDATRRESHDELADNARWLLRRMSAMGVTTVEAKSGYGLDTATEQKMLEVIRDLSFDRECPVGIVATFLGAHAVPREYAGRTSEYVDLMIRDMLPRFRGLADNCDVFCEKDVFEIEDSRRLLSAAKALDYGIKLHADEIVSLGGAELAAEMGALSADHLLHVSDRGIDRMIEAGVVATCLPLTAFALKEPYAPARKIIDRGGAVALATDLNPGSCFSGSIPLTIALACIYMKMEIEEVIAALTINAAAAIGRADSIGSIEVGKRGDFALLRFDNINMLPYYVGMNCVETTIRGGRIVNQNEY